MSAQFIVEYAGAPVKFASIGFDLVPCEGHASVFSSESDAWQAAFKHRLSPKHTQVVNLYARPWANL